ncbi:DUF4040 family protein [Dietzia sp.]|uniref:DUF4040 family protein n=1 Tax=Dietzia sp. TaxID=1871616 RepID=UPI002FDA81E3
MTLLLALGASAVSVLLAWPLTRALGRAAGWPLAALYVVGLAALAPEARAVFSGERGGTASIDWVPSRGWTLELVAEPIGMLFAIIALGIGAIVLVYSTAYLDRRPPAEAGTVPAHHEPPPGTPLAPAPGYAFYQLITAFTLGMLLLVLTDSMAVLYIGWELTSLASFALILGAGRPGFTAALRTLSATFVGGLALLAALALMWSVTGTGRLSAAIASDRWGEHPELLAVLAVLVVVAVFTKSAQWPFHYWLPGAMAAATPVSAYLHAAAVVKAGIFLAMRFSPLFADEPTWRVLLVAVGLGTAIMAAIFTMQKFDLKQLMAYSTVSQLGWIVAAIGVGTDTALAAAALHTFAHALFKSGLFMLIGVVDHSAHTRDIRELRAIPGRIRAMPVAFTATLVGAAGMAGIPPLLGFVSKESMLSALGTLPDGVPRTLALVGAAVAAAGTVAYCARIVLGAFVDTDRSATATPATAAEAPSLHRVSPVLLWSAVIPAVAGLPLAFVLGPFDAPLDAISAAAVPGSHPHSHLALWHGLGLELGITLAAIAVGAAIAYWRRPIERALDRRLLPFDGAGASDAVEGEISGLGAAIGELSESRAPGRHVSALLATMCAFGLLGVFALAEGSGFGALPPLRTGPFQWSDLVVFLAVAAAVGGMVIMRSRIAVVVLLSAVGIAVTVQMFALGAPDVGLTQLLVEAITVIVFMLVIRRLPATFSRPTPGRHRTGIVLGACVGLAAVAGTLLLTSRRDRSALGMWYLDNTEEVSGGHNVVNVILVEFRALDTLGELAVLGMAGIAILAVVGSVGIRFRDPARPAGARQRGTTPPAHDGGDVPASRADTAQSSTDVDEDATLPTSPVARREALSPAARAAFSEARRNTAPLRLAARFAVPALLLVSALLFLRGHNAPGGGFIAALVAAAAVSLIYLAKPADDTLTKGRTPAVVTGIGFCLAGLTGIAGYAWGTFLEPAHVEFAGVHLTSAMVFDAGVFLAVLGLLLVTIASLGTERLRSDSDDYSDTLHGSDTGSNTDNDTDTDTDREEALP